MLHCVRVSRSVFSLAFQPELISLFLFFSPVEKFTPSTDILHSMFFNNSLQVPDSLMLYKSYTQI